MDEDKSDLARRLDYRFRDPRLLTDALTHPSADPERGGASSFERLEFLGDRVLGLVVADLLLRQFPGEAEGGLTRRLNALVRRETLTRVALALGIDRAIVLSKDNGGGTATPAMLADACEAVLGAVFVDGGFEAASRLVRAQWQPLIGDPAGPPRDPKMALQEWAQAKGLPLPKYTVVSQEGPAHDPMFRVAVSVAGSDPAAGSGPTKRAAEQQAAAALLARIGR